MKRFNLGQRVFVRATGFDGAAVDPPIAGRVVRLRRDDEGAWVELDERRADVHYPFPVGDDRERHVLVFPEQCHAVPR